MKRILLIILFVVPLSMFSQEKDPALQREARQFVREGNELYNQQKFSDAEVAYKKALEKDPSYEIANYNLGNALSQQKRGKEAIAQYELVAKTTTNKFTKAESFHNIGNTHFDAKDYQNSIEAYKNSLRNNPNDDETRYNLALAQEMLEDQKNKDKDKDKDKDDKDKKDKKDDQEDKKDDKKDGDDDKKDDEKDKEGDKKDDQKDKKEQPQPGKLSPQQVQQLLEAMNNEEKKTQEKMNAKKERGKKIKQEKDW